MDCLLNPSLHLLQHFDAERIQSLLQHAGGHVAERETGGAVVVCQLPRKYTSRRRKRLRLFCLCTNLPDGLDDEFSPIEITAYRPPTKTVASIEGEKEGLSI